MDAGSASVVLMETDLNHLGQMKSLPVTLLCNLLAATEAICQDHGRGRGVADRRQEFALPDRDGDIVFVSLKSERTRHAAATRSEQFMIETQFFHDRALGLKFEQRLVMAVALHHRLAFNPRQVRTGVLVQEFAEEQCLLPESFGELII